MILRLNKLVASLKLNADSTEEITQEKQHI